MRLIDTMLMTESVDYKIRFRAEYLQVKIRKERLDEMLQKHETGTLGFEPTCPRELLRAQSDAMGAYIAVLQERAKIESIDLNEEPTKYDVDLMGTKDDPALQAFWWNLRQTIMEIGKTKVPVKLNYKMAELVMLQMLENFAQAAGDITGDAVDEYKNYGIADVNCEGQSDNRE